MIEFRLPKTRLEEARIFPQDRTEIAGVVAGECVCLSLAPRRQKGVALSDDANVSGLHA